MTLERVAADFFVGRSPDYDWKRVYGGQVVAQALMAASRTVEQPHRVHSLHAYFVLGGVPKESILFEVDRLRDGRSFSTRRVVARQASGAILNLDASFQADEGDVEIQSARLPGDLPDPTALPLMEWSGLGEVREVPPTPGVAHSQLWARIKEDLGDDPILHACGLAYLSDHNPMDSIVMMHPNKNWNELMTVSLDHNIWFHRQGRADDWMLFDMSADGLVNARGLSFGTVFSASGVHLASTAQEGLVRSPRK